MIASMFSRGLKIATFPTRMALSLPIKATKLAFRLNPLLPNLDASRAANPQLEGALRDLNQQLDASLGGSVEAMLPSEREAHLERELHSAQSHLMAAGTSLLKVYRLLSAPAPSVIEHQPSPCKKIS